MSEKPVAIIGKNPIIDDAVKVVQDSMKQFYERVTFVKRRLANEAEQQRKDVRRLWDNLGAILVAEGVLSHYNRDTDNIGFRDGVVYVAANSVRTVESPHDEDACDNPDCPVHGSGAVVQARELDEDTSRQIIAMLERLEKS